MTDADEIDVAGLDTGMLDSAAGADMAEREVGPPDAALPMDLAVREVSPPDAALPMDMAVREVSPPDAAVPMDLAVREVGPPDVATVVDLAPSVDGACAGPLECPSGVCTLGICQAPSCSDNVKNGTETAIDCGGSCPQKCADNQPCVVAGDCRSAVCTMNLCRASSCTDGVKNGTETDIDCGGACPNKCGTGKNCTTAGNCVSNICTAGICQGTPVTVELPIAASADDAEESLVTSSVVLDSSDLELDFDGASGGFRQVVGIRFVKVPLPKGASIITAYVQFTAKDTSAKAASVTIKGQATDNAPVFTTASGSITARPTTAASVAWTSIPNWTADSVGPTTRTPELKTIVEELIQRPGWAPTNAIVFLLTGNGGDRNPYSFDGRASSAPRLHIEYVP